MQRPLAFDATREVIDPFSVAFPFWPGGRPFGAWRPHQVSPFPRETATGCAISMPLPQLYAVRVGRNPYNTRYDQWAPNRYALGVEFSGTTACCIGTLLHAQNGSHSNPPHQLARTQIESVFFFEKDATDAAKEIAGRNNACSAPHEQPGPGFEPNLLRIKKARLSTRLGSGAETADHFMRLFF
jgi:hypothetical protein